MTYVVASLVERSIAGVSDSSKKAFRSGADLVEVRLDHISRGRIPKRTLAALRKAVRGPAIATLRSSREGGLSSMKGRDRALTLRDVLASGFEFVDLELEGDSVLLGELRGGRSRPKIIASSHFTKPVQAEVFAERLARACRAGDIGKVAMPCEDASQGLMVARAGLRFRALGENFAVIGMGEQGQLTRACARHIGSSMVYACVDGRKAAPGQMDVAAQSALMHPKALVIGLVGHPVGHSVSKPMQEAAMRKAGIDGIYLPLDIPGELSAKDLETLRSIGFSGVNVTIPHKRAAYNLCDEKGAAAAVTGSVNTIRFQGRAIFGENTDVIGFSRMIDGKIRTGKRTTALVLGAGGSARAIAHVLAGAGASVTISARRARAAEDLAGQFDAETAVWSALSRRGEKSDLVVNCTPIGMKGRVAPGMIPGALFGKGTRFFDIVYNPPVTSSMRTAVRKGSKAYGGLDMLVHQGAESFRIWTGKTADIAVMRRAAKEAVA